MTTDYLGNDKHTNLIGCTLAEARALLSDLETIRVVKEDGVPKVGTDDYLPDRINVAVESDRIIAIESEG